MDEFAIYPLFPSTVGADDCPKPQDPKTGDLALTGDDQVGRKERLSF